MSIEVKNLTGGQGTFKLGPVDITLAKGKLTALIGPNGCGKSTLLGLVAGVLPLKGGSVSVAGHDLVTTRRRKLAREVTVLPQNPVVPPSISVEQLVHYGRAPHQNMLGMRSSKDKAIVAEAMHTADIYDLRERHLSDLSGGQRQRAFIAMGLAQDTPYILLDEPTSFLDVRYQFDILELLKALTQSGRTCVVVLHDIAQAARYADVLVVMKNGAIVEEGEPSQVISPVLLNQVYGIDAHVYPDPVSGTPVMTLS
ncbi:ABC transporter ATP-binding protein [Roseibium sp. SCPC15]|uniref:ABC transporter ATP-binding protein n=1 Tax=Roseibium sp. SCP15 TaxID=3141376 RepID=UPI00333DBFE7